MIELLGYEFSKPTFGTHLWSWPLSLVHSLPKLIKDPSNALIWSKPYPNTLDNSLLIDHLQDLRKPHKIEKCQSYKCKCQSLAHPF